MKDLTGQRFGKLTVTKLLFSGIRQTWLCKCDCGNSFAALDLSLYNGNAYSCGCVHRRYPYVGRKFGSLTVLELVDFKITVNGTEVYYFRCRCDCGNEVIRTDGGLRKRKPKTCGKNCGLRKRVVKGENNVQSDESTNVRESE